MTKWTLNSWSSSLSPQSVTLAPCVFIACTKGTLWNTDLTQHTWIEFTSDSAWFQASPLVLFGDLEQGWVSLTHVILQSWALVYPDFCPVSGLPWLLYPCLFFHLIPPFPEAISMTFFSPENQQLLMWLWMMVRLGGLEGMRPQANNEECVSSCHPGDWTMSPHTNLLTEGLARSHAWNRHIGKWRKSRVSPIPTKSSQKWIYSFWMDIQESQASFPGLSTNRYPHPPSHAS